MVMCSISPSLSMSARKSTGFSTNPLTFKRKFRKPLCARSFQSLHAATIFHFGCRDILSVLLLLRSKLIQREELHGISDEFERVASRVDDSMRYSEPTQGDNNETNAHKTQESFLAFPYRRYPSQCGSYSRTNPVIITTRK